ncbi:MAG: PhoU domain-containing protein [Nanoarchaeota archaeon]
MKRKVVQQGPATLMISLPSKWVKENKVGKGAELEITEEKGKLTLTVENSAQTRSTKEIHANDIGILNQYFVNYPYQKGYDEVTLRYDDPQFTDIIENRAKQMIGFEVVEKGKNFTTLKMLMTIDQQEFATVLKKLFQITLVMGDKITEAVEKNNIALLNEVKQDEKENNKYTDLCVRILYKNKYKYPENGFALYALLRELEQIGDVYKALANGFEEQNGKNKEILMLYNRVHSYFRLYYELYYRYDAEMIQRFFQMKNELHEACEQHLVTAKKEEVIILSHLMTLTNKIFDLKGVLFLQHL